MTIASIFFFLQQQTSEVIYSTSEVSKLQKQNACLRAVVAEMRKEMENLTRELSPLPMACNTEDMKPHTCPTDDIQAREEEMKELKVRCLPVDDCPEESSMTATPTPKSAASENLVSHVKSLRNNISKSVSNKLILKCLLT